MKRHTVPLLLSISIAALLLCAVTIVRCFESYDTLRGFSVGVTAVTPVEGQNGAFTAHLTFGNESNTPATLETLHAALYWDKRLIGAVSVDPRGLVVPARDNATLIVKLVSNLDEQSLPRVSQDFAKNPWHLRLHLRVGLPDRHDSFRLDFEKRVGD